MSIGDLGEGCGRSGVEGATTRLAAPVGEARRLDRAAQALVGKIGASRRDAAVEGHGLSVAQFRNGA